MVLPTKKIDQSLELYFLLDDGRLEASLLGVDSFEATIDAFVEPSEPGVYGKLSFRPRRRLCGFLSLCLVRGKPPRNRNHSIHSTLRIASLQAFVA